MGIFDSKELKQLRNENEELKTKFHFMYEKEENAKKLEEVLRRLRKEVSDLNTQRNQLKESLKFFETEEQSKRSEIEALEQRIVELTLKKDELLNNAASFGEQLSGVSSKIETDEEDFFAGTSLSSTDQQENYDDLNNKKSELEDELKKTNDEIDSLTNEEQALQERLNLKREEIEDIANQELQLLSRHDELNKKVESTESRIAELETEKQTLLNEIEEKKKEVFEYTQKLDALEKEISLMEESIVELQGKEVLIKQSIAELEEEKNSKSGFLEEIKNIDKELDEKKKLLAEADENLDKLGRETSFKQKEIYALEQTLQIKSTRLSKINLELLQLEKKNKEILDQQKKFEELKDEFYKKYQSEKDAYENITQQHTKLQELLPLLDKRKQEIEASNAELENRFTRMFQKFNRELNDITKKRSVLEQIILKKEKDIDERDQLLFEKIAALEESERVLNMRQAEIDSFENMLKTLNEQKETLREDLIHIDEDASERKNYNNDLKIETELLLKKKVMLEKGLQELLKMMNDNFNKTENRKLKLNDELQAYEDKINSIRDKVKDSMNELVELKETINSAKVEHEEYKGNIAKLASMKKRLNEEILKQQSTLQKFQKIREKLKIEQAIAKNRQVGGPYLGDKPDSSSDGDEGQIKNPQIYKL